MSEYHRLTVKKVGDVTVARFRDWRIEEANVKEVERELFRLVETDGCDKLLLNFGAVDFLSSAGLGRLLALEKKAKEHECTVKISDVRQPIQQIFLITKLNRLFEIRDTETDALASFRDSA